MWAYVVAVLVGLLILALVVWVLFKVGRLESGGSEDGLVKGF